MEHIVVEDINTNTGGIFERKRYQKKKNRNLVQQTSPAKVRTWLLTVQSYSSRPFGNLRRLFFRNVSCNRRCKQLYKRTEFN